MSPAKGQRGELSPDSGRPLPNPEPVEAAILSDRSLAVRFERGPWVRPTLEEVRAYGPCLGDQDASRTIGDWFFQCAFTGQVRFTSKPDGQKSRPSKNGDEDNAFRRLFEGDQNRHEPKAITFIMPVSTIKAFNKSHPTPYHEPVPDPNIDIPADVMPIDIPPTPFAHAYSSKGLAAITDKLHLLKSINCSYLSTLHHAPTLLELKQHAQALTVLIYEMSGPSTSSAQVDNNGVSARVFEAGEPFDWLNDLSTPYVNTEPEHNAPLTTLMNTYHHDPTAVRTTQICPLSSIPRTKEDRDAGEPGLPYMTHEELTKHANDCLEILDHEFSAEGGLLSILPDMENESQRSLSGKTILGQFVLFTQRLVQRVHELELRSANAADLLSGERVIPTQSIGLIPGLNGRDGTRPTPVVYPQHKYVLANAGDSVWNQLTKMLTEKEKLDRDLHNYNVQQGLSASSQWESSRAMEFRNGLTHIDVLTRYTRVWDANSVAGAPAPIFIIPGHAVHPGIAATRDMENKPHVVQVVKPQYPERLSKLEEKYEEKKYEYEDIIMDHLRLKQDNKDQLETIAVQQLMLKDLQAENSYRRAEQQGRGVQELAKFRNPIAEREKKLEEIQRDFDNKLLATEFALRDAKRYERAKEGELRKLANWREVETAKIQAILQQNEALTTGVRAGYMLTAGAAGAGMAAPASIPKVTLCEASEPLLDVTDTAQEPYPISVNSMRIFADAAGVLKSQPIVDGVLGSAQDANSAEQEAFEARRKLVMTGQIPSPAGPLVVITALPGVTSTTFSSADEPTSDTVGESGPDAEVQYQDSVPVNNYSVPLTNPSLDVYSTSASGKRKFRHPAPPSRISPDEYSSDDIVPSWDEICNMPGDQTEILIAAAMESIGWYFRYYVLTHGDEKIWSRQFYRPGTQQTLRYEDCGAILATKNPSIPIFQTVTPDWLTVSEVHFKRAMMDLGWENMPAPDTAIGLEWGRMKDDTWIPLQNPRAYLAKYMDSSEIDDEGDEDTKRMIDLGYTSHNLFKGGEDEGDEEDEEDLRWVVIANGENWNDLDLGGPGIAEDEVPEWLEAMKKERPPFVEPPWV